MHVRPVPKVSIFMALTTKIVTEKAKKWPKMARFWPKSRYNGRVMAREVFFYQCLWVTKFCAKFGCSRTPRTASVPNSFIVLRCMWKEPAPFKSRSSCELPQIWGNSVFVLESLFIFSDCRDGIILQPKDTHVIHAEQKQFNQSCLDILSCISINWPCWPSSHVSLESFLSL